MLESLRSNGQHLREINHEYRNLTGGVLGITKAVISERVKDIRISSTNKFAEVLESTVNSLFPFIKQIVRYEGILPDPAQHLIDPVLGASDTTYPFYFDNGEILPGNRMKKVLKVLGWELRFLHRDKSTDFYKSIQQGMSSTETDKHHVGAYVQELKEFFQKAPNAKYFIDQALCLILGHSHENEEAVVGDHSLTMIFKQNGNSSDQKISEQMLKKQIKILTPVVNFIIPEGVRGFQFLRRYLTQILAIYDNYAKLKNEARYAPLPVLFDRLVDMKVGNMFWFFDKREQVLCNIYCGDDIHNNELKLIQDRFKDRQIDIVEEFTEDGSVPNNTKKKGKYYTVKVRKWHASQNPEYANEQKNMQEEKINKYLRMMKRFGAHEALMGDIRKILLQPYIEEARKYGIDINITE